MHKKEQVMQDMLVEKLQYLLVVELSWYKGEKSYRKRKNKSEKKLSVKSLISEKPT